MSNESTPQDEALPETEPAVAVVEGSQTPITAPPRPTRASPKWETDAKERLRSALRRYSKPLADLCSRDANEGDTRLLVTDFLCEGLGYDKYEDLTTEYQVKGEFADYGVRIDKQLVAFIEVKRVTTKLNVRHLRQVEMYAVNEGVEWVLLTNGSHWQVYHLTGGLPVVIDLALDADILGAESGQQKVNQLFYLSRESFKRRQIDDLWEMRRATSPKSLSTVLLSESVVTAIRRELKRSTDQTVEDKEIARLLRETVIRADALS